MHWGKLYPPERFPWMQCLLFVHIANTMAHQQSWGACHNFHRNTSIPIPTIIDVICPDEDLFHLWHVFQSPCVYMWHHITANPSALLILSWTYMLVISALESGASICDSVKLLGDPAGNMYIACEPIGPFVDKDKLHRFLLSRVGVMRRMQLFLMLKSHSENLMRSEPFVWLVIGTARWFQSIGTMLEVATLYYQHGWGYSTDIPQYEHELDVDDKIGQFSVHSFSMVHLNLDC